MLGRRIDNGEKEMHFSNMAKRFALDAKMFRCRAAVHVEDKDDIFFWNIILKHFRPDDRFHFIAGSRNEFGNETRGVTQCLKFKDFLSDDFFICIDSDYRYLLHERHVDVRHYILQTYTYSFENHHCFVEGLDDVCSRVTRLPNHIFDFRRFLKTYSNIIYDLFIWHLYFLSTDTGYFSKYEFNAYINLVGHKPYSIVRDNASHALDHLRMRVDKKTGYLGRHYPDADLESVKRKMEIRGLTPDTTYLFIRGHNMYDMISGISREVCRRILEQEKDNRNTREMIRDLYKDRSSVDIYLKQNILFGSYIAIRKIEEDVRYLLG